MTTFAVLSISSVVLAAGWFTVRFIVSARVRPCDCGLTMQHSFWLHRHNHPRLRWLLTSAVLATVMIVLAAARSDWVNFALYGALIAPGEWWWVWLHRRRIRRAARALGRVIVDATGRLRITLTPTPEPA